MPSLTEMYSHPEDVERYTEAMRFYRERFPLPLPPLREYGPEQDDRWCLKHYKSHRADAWFGFHNFGCDLRHGRKCVYCAEDERKAWLAEVEGKLRRGLAAAARGEKVEW